MDLYTSDLHDLGPRLRNSESNEEAYRLLKSVFDNFSPVEIVSELARTEWDSPSQVIELIDGSGLLPKTRSSVKSAAVYFYTLGLGGGERVTKEIALTWKSMGLDSRIFVDLEPSDPSTLPVDIPCITIPNCTTIRADNYSLRAESLAIELSTADADAIVFAHWYVRTLPFDLLLSRLLGIQTFLYIQNSFTLFFLDDDLPFDYVEIPLSYILANAVICLSKMDKLFWSNFNQNVVFTHNPVTIEPKGEGSKLQGHKIIWPARLSHDKYPERVIPIMKELVKAIPDATLYMVGPIENGIEPMLRTLIRQNGLEGNILLCGPKPEAEMHKWYEKCDAYLLTSRKEGYPLALAEAQACGLPCVIYDLPYLELAYTGGVISVPQDNYKMAAKQLETLLKDKERAKGIGEKGRLYIENRTRDGLEKFWNKLFSGTFTASYDKDYELKRIMAKELMSSHKQHYLDTELAINAGKNKLERLEEECSQLRRRLDGFENSPSFKLGRILTYVPRHLRNLFRER